MAGMETVKGGCHCGAVRFEATADLSKSMECNCSICEKKGFIFAFTPREAFKLAKGDDCLTEYRFNKKAVAHLFCKTCGVQPFGYGATPDGREVAAINVRCVDGVDLGALTPHKFDGKSL
ncbi:MAG: GFA family protein [Amphiplicatus sp.]